MKKSSLFSLIMSAFIAAVLFTACPSPTVTPKVEYVNITFDAGDGALFSNGGQTMTQRVKKGKSITLPVPEIQDSDLANIKELSHYTINDTDEVYVKGTPFTEDTVLKAVYCVSAPTDISLTKKNQEGTKLQIELTHPSNSASLSFTIDITDITDPAQESSLPQITTSDRIKIVDTLTSRHTYKIEARAVYQGESSAIKSETVNMVPFYYVTIDGCGYGTIGGEVATSLSIQVDENTSFTLGQEYSPIIKSGFLTTYVFNHFVDATTSEEVPIGSSFTVNRDYTINAVYTLIAPTNLTLSKEDKGTSMELTIRYEHASDEVTYEITITDLTTENPDNKRELNNPIGQKSIVVSDLKYFHTYEVSVKAVHYSNKSAAITDSIVMDQYYTVTYNLGIQGNYNGSSSFSEQVQRGAYTAKTPAISSTYQNIYVFKHYTVNDTNNVFVDGTTITSNITLKAVYELISPSNLNLTKVEGDPCSINIQITHPAASGAQFKIKITNKADAADIPVNVTVSSKNYKAINLTAGNSYNVKVNTVCGAEESTIISKDITLDPKNTIPVLFLMYMDGDNNLNDPIFMDLNEVELGLYKAGNAADNVKIFTLWDGGPRSGGSGNSAYTNHYADSSSHLLELGKDSSELYFQQNGQWYVSIGYSQDTKDHSSGADWLSTGEVDMSDKNTLKNFIKWVTDRYTADKIILQFSNHGGGPRSYMPKTVTLENGEKIALKDMYGRRSMCWDDSSTDPDSFLKTSDLSEVFAELGFGPDNKIEMIMEDVCLGASIEEAYEVKDYANYFLASPNTIPGNGFDYVNLVKVLCENATSPTLSTTLGTAVITQYAADYAEDDSFWCEMINNDFNTSFTSVQEFLQECYNSLIAPEEEGGKGLSPEEASEQLYSYCFDKSVNADVSTLSLVDLNTLNSVKTALDAVAQELIDNINTNCSNIYADKDGNLVPLGESAKYYVNRILLLLNKALRPGCPIFYQGTFSWLYDIGYMTDVMFKWAQIDEWTALTTKLTDLDNALKTSIVVSWRDGMFYGPTYSTIEDTNILCSSSNSYYGLTISGETFKVQINGNQAYLVSGDYPSWYEDLKFGQDCTWQDLLEMEPWR